MTTKKQAPAGEKTAQKRAKNGAATAKPEARTGASARPRIRASHAHVETDGPKKAKPRVSPVAAPRGAVESRKLSAPKRVSTRPRPPEGRMPEASKEARSLALAVATAGLDKKAVGIEILDVCGKVDYADFLVVMTGRSDRHVQAIASGIEDELRTKHKTRALSIEGMTTGTWVLIDFSDVVVHVFQEDARSLYDIEGLWSDANRVPVANSEPSAPTRGD